MEFLNKQQLIKNEVITASHKSLSESLNTHVHDFFEIEYIIKGCGTYIIDGVEYPIQDNMLFFMSPSAFHSFDNVNAEVINVMFPCSICDMSILFKLFFGKKSAVFTDNPNTLIKRHLERIVTCCNEKDYTYAITFLQCMLYELNTLTPLSNENYTTHVQSAIIYITENFRENITLTETAEHVGLVPVYLSKLFYKEIGVNFKVYLDNIRFDHATKLLTFSNASISDVCAQSGFVDYANFHKRFKKKYNVTPKEYRKLHQIT